MSKERKKVESKPIIKVEPKTRERPSTNIEKTDQRPKPVIKAIIDENNISISSDVKETRTRVKVSLDKYIRYSFEDLRDDNNVKTINNRVQNDEIKYAYYATDNDIGYHYYIITKK